MPCVRTPQGGRCSTGDAFRDKTANAVDKDMERENGAVKQPLASLRGALSRNRKEHREAERRLAALHEEEHCRVDAAPGEPGEADCELWSKVVYDLYGTLNSKLHLGGVGRAIPDCTVTAAVSGVKETAVALSVGTTVKIHSLVKAQELNGLEGVLLEYDASKQRWRVWVAGGRTVGIRGANLIKVYEPIRFASSDLAAPSPPVSHEAPSTGYAHTPQSASSISFMSGGRLYLRAKAKEVKELAGSGCAEEDVVDEEEVKQEEERQEEEQGGAGEEEQLSRSERKIMKMGRRVDKLLASFSLPDSDDTVSPP